MARATCLILTLLFGFAASSMALDVEVKGLFHNGAFVEVNGKRHTLRAGERSPEGVLLVEADMQKAVLEIDGERKTLEISRRVSTNLSHRKKALVRIQPGDFGHYFTPGRINGQAVDFMVDTGASTVAMNLPTAQRLGLNYRAGQRVSLSTASGVARGYRVMLDRVRVGAIEIRNVEAVVSMNEFPSDILLGNSYLNRVDMRREGGILILEAQF